MEKKRDSGLDLLRCFAILSVLLLHSTEAAPLMPESLKFIFSYGWIGVDLFFVLSGFLIGSQAISSKRKESTTKNFHEFWAKRWFRTLPLYYTVLFCYVLIKPLVMGGEFKPAIGPFLIFLQNYMVLTDFVQSWSICIEEQFYIILPLFTFALLPNLSKKPSFWLAMSVFGVFLRYLVTTRIPSGASAAEVDYFVRFPLYTHFDGLSAGLFLASTRAVWGQWKKPQKKLSLGLGAISLFSICWFLGPHLTVSTVHFYFTLLPISFALLLVGLKNWEMSGGISFLINWVALLSYGAYLWNNLLIRVFARYLSEIHWQVGVILFLLCTHLIALTTYVLIEKPFLNLREKYLLRIK
jgi:peptidoglycan/LPS O-acetylase OafA/YrhL